MQAELYCDWVPPSVVMFSRRRPLHAITIVLGTVGLNETCCLLTEPKTPFPPKNSEMKNQITFVISIR